MTSSQPCIHTLTPTPTLPEALVEEVDVVPRLVEQAAPTGEVLQVSGLTHLLKHRVGERLLGRHEHLISVNRCGGIMWDTCLGPG